MAANGGRSLMPYRIINHISKSKPKHPKHISFVPVLSSERHIRVLRVEPGELDEQIQCSFRQILLDDRDPEAFGYEALSYSWGDPTKVHSILVDGVEIRVPENLHAALRRFRNEHEKNLGVIWIDYLCINQDDVDERNAQVSQMREVYERALRVVAWLGEDSRDGNVSYDFLRQATQYWMKPNEEEWLIEAVSSPSYEDRWHALSRFLERNYWTRMWIVQEVISGKFVDVWWGENHVLTWDEFIALGYQMNFYRASISQRPEYWVRQLSPMMERFAAIDLESVRQSIQEGHGYWTLYPLMMKTRMKAATDPRDKVYGIMGLADKFSQDVSLLKPDYRLTKLEVYTNTFIHAVRQGNQPHPSGVLESPLNIICAGEYLKDNDKDWPTWLPRWDRNLSYAPMQFRVVTHPFATSGKYQGGMNLDVDGRCLRLHGILVDELEKAGDSLPVIQYRKQPGLLGKHGFRDSLKIKTEFDVCASWWRIAVQNDSSGDVVFKAAMTLSCGRDCDEEMWDDDELSMMATFWMRYKTGKEVLYAIEADPEFWEGMRFHNAFFSHSRNRRFCVTREKRFALCPHQAESGDVICILMGCDFPLVLRRVDNHFIFIGDCYTHGIMDGEAMGLLKKGHYRVRTIELR